MNMKKILVVDDNADIVQLIRNRLQQRGFEVETACDAVTALERIEAQVPDLITLDILMPGIIGDNDKYGASLCETLKWDKAYSKIPIVIVSGLRRDASPVITGMVRQADAYIRKPIDSAQLIAAIEKILREQTGGDRR